VLYINIDSQEEAYTEAEVRQAHDDVAQLAAVGAHNLARMSSGSNSSATSVCALSTSTIIWTKSWTSELARLSRAGFLAFDRVMFNGGDQELASFAVAAATSDVVLDLATGFGRLQLS
jgi:hypothetical protein